MPADAHPTPPPSDVIAVRGARTHNLKEVDLDLPRNRLVVFCGASGSGKTSMAIDTLYAEGQRRYIESFSAYTRQFLEQLDKPDCERIDRPCRRRSRSHARAGRVRTAPRSPRQPRWPTTCGCSSPARVR